MSLAPYAVQDSNTKGRQYPTSDSHDRDQFQRDKTRILHSSAFRRLQYKTQVFTNDTGDNFRTRLTHSLEVAQVASSVAKALNVNDTLAETLALAHDLGHAPFGHTGQDTLDELMKSQGGFEHNMQTMRIGSELESPYVEHQGLNLMYETLEGMLKHCSDRRARDLMQSGDSFLGDIGRRFLDKKSPTLESQIVDWSDAIAYLHADMEDAINMKILDPKDMGRHSPKFNKHWAKAQVMHPHVDEMDQRIIHQTIRSMMSASIQDLIEESKKNIELSGVKTLEDVRNARELIGFRDREKREHLNLKKVSKQLIYDHPLVAQQRLGQSEKMEALFRAYEQHPEIIPGFDASDARGKDRQNADCIAALTDRGIDRELDRARELLPNFFKEKSKAVFKV